MLSPTLIIILSISALLSTLIPIVLILFTLKKGPYAQNQALLEINQALNLQSSGGQPYTRCLPIFQKPLELHGNLNAFAFHIHNTQSHTIASFLLPNPLQAQFTLIFKKKSLKIKGTSHHQIVTDDLQSHILSTVSTLSHFGSLSLKGNQLTYQHPKPLTHPKEIAQFLQIIDLMSCIALKIRDHKSSWTTSTTSHSSSSAPPSPPSPSLSGPETPSPNSKTNSYA